jgi:hypothetical protein
MLTLKIFKAGLACAKIMLRIRLKDVLTLSSEHIQTQAQDQVEAQNYTLTC